MDNPYDRRRRGESPDRMERGTMMAGSAPSFETPRALAIQDLDALAFSAHSRGVKAEADRLTRQHGDDLHTARREAWAEGHGQGNIDGQQALLRSIDEQFGEKARQLVERGQELRSLDRRKVTKLDLEQALDITVDLLANLIAAHHNAFVREMPF